MLNILKNDFTVNFANFIDFLEHHGLRDSLDKLVVPRVFSKA